MSRRPDRERAILAEVQDGICKDDLIAKLAGNGHDNESAIKSLQRAYRNLLKKGLMTEEPKTMLRGYRISGVTWVYCSPKRENQNSGNNN